MNTRRDTIARWIALTIALAMLVSLLLNLLFIRLAGTWAQPPLADTGLFEQIAMATRLIEAAPQEQRPALARAATRAAFNVDWQPRPEFPAMDEHIFHDGTPRLNALLAGPAHRIEALTPGEWPAGHAGDRYMVRVQLHDQSWVAFTTPSRSWGLEQPGRYAIIIGLGLVSTLGVAWIATRRLARPLQQFTSAAQRFGGDFRAPPIDAVGPYEIRQAILAFNTMQAQIQHFVADRTQMLAAISHDLRAPLTRMRLRGEFIDDAEQQHKLFRDVDEMQAMIEAALDFFRDEARLEPSTPFDLAELLLTLIDDYRDQGIEIGFSGPDHLVHVGRPLGLRRVVTNLLDNAVKYAGGGRVELLASEDHVHIRCLDSGPGIPAESLEQVFAPFFRLEASRNRATGGVGLGLSSARAIVHEQGGELHIANRPEGGLVAHIQLPMP
ncbi:ATP-binding protein [Pseudomonas sp. LRF_L74]|uniref:ATP-binding protein n=1 Tax=Pseudomonas sp. LRF_L74 TaxID=3369422 RepID=UPI003F62B56D